MRLHKMILFYVKGGSRFTVYMFSQIPKSIKFSSSNSHMPFALIPGKHSIVVSFTAPHRISTIYCEDEGILGYSKALLRGQTAEIFHGPKTNAEKLSAAIKNTAQNISLIAEFHLYDVNGQCQTVLLNVAPYRGVGGAAVACRISVVEFLLCSLADDIVQTVDDAVSGRNQPMHPVARNLKYNGKEVETIDLRESQLRMSVST